MASVIDRLRGDHLVDNWVYWDQRVYEIELERIFSRVWLFVCHESEVAEPGDYLTTEVAGSPIIVDRDKDGGMHAFYNTCRHRGSLVALEERGHCSSFRCPYHFWVYGLDGRLLGVSNEEAYEGSGFHREDFPLVELACESVFGLVFINLGDDPESLAGYLGPRTIEELSRPLASGRYEVVERKTTELPINWKIWPENARDGYHVPFVHPFFRKASPAGEYRLLENGHAVQDLGMERRGVDPALWPKLQAHRLPGVKEAEGYVMNLFPDVTIMMRTNMISVESQRAVGPTATILESRTLGMAGDSEEVRSLRRLCHDTWLANPLELEDMPVWIGQQKGVAARGVRYSIIARGADATVGTRGDDNRLRHFWVKWRELMGVEQNSIDV